MSGCTKLSNNLNRFAFGQGRKVENKPEKDRFRTCSRAFICTLQEPLPYSPVSVELLPLVLEQIFALDLANLYLVVIQFQMWTVGYYI
jgi:hypothetical protein